MKNEELRIKKTKMKNNLEDRLIDFAVMIIQLCENMKSSQSASHLSGQILRSGTSPALNYGEAQSGESKRDFIHKIKIVLKELRETMICMKIISRCELCRKNDLIVLAMKENNELIAIFTKSAITAQKNLATGRKNEG